MTANWTLNNDLTVVQIMPTARVADATPVLSTDFDVRSYAHGSRFLVVLQSHETNAGNTGGTWTVTESATDGGSYTAATTDGVLTAIGAGTDVIRSVAVYPNPAKPFVLVTFTGADANAEVDVTATLVVVPAVV
jgi:hypothetical protein